MNTAKIIGILLLVAGALALAYGGFTYTDSHEAEIGALEFTVKEKDFFGVPVWLGIGALVVGAVLLVGGARKT